MEDLNAMQTELPKFHPPRTLDEARSQCINLGDNLNEHAYILGKVLMWVKDRKKGEYLNWIRNNLWFKRATAHNYVVFAKECDAKGRLLDYSYELYRLRFGEFETQKEELLKNAAKYKPGDTTILLGKFQDVWHQIKDSSIDMICTDPPWDKQWLPQFDDLAVLAERVLVPGGYLFTFFGKMFLPEKSK